MTTPITAIQFKQAFYRQFFFVNDWNVNNAYEVKDIVFYVRIDTYNGAFYVCKVPQIAGSPPPTEGADWGILLDTQNFVTDTDISQATSFATANFNSKLRWNTTTKQDETAFGFLMAHFLETNIQSGIGAPTPVQKITSTRVGNVSESFENVNWVDEKSPLYPYTTTRSGCQYIQMVRPLVVGATTFAIGITHP